MKKGGIRTQNPTGKSCRSLHAAKKIRLLAKHKKRSFKRVSDQQRQEGGWGGRNSQQRNGRGAVRPQWVVLGGRHWALSCKNRYTGVKVKIWACRTRHNTPLHSSLLWVPTVQTPVSPLFAWCNTTILHVWSFTQRNIYPSIPPCWHLIGVLLIKQVHLDRYLLPNKLPNFYKSF